ncbi:COMM domain-containing protein 3-like [Pecten maximus]|uniref:COMM domain-containing protein 3-like n=1 Tax=Pecten maximus TaxID=6579 RepID=UPI001458E7F9|nr:COMM domain-containing protein 3-like [Pecten maximus]
MELSQSVIDGLSVVGDSAHVPNKCYQKLLDAAFNGVVDSEQRNRISGDETFSGVDKVVLKEAYAGLVSCIIEATKHDTEAASLEALLEDCKFTADRIKAFITSYQERKQIMQILLGNVGVTPPHIVDVDWRLDYYIKNNHLEKVNEAVYLISLKTEVPGKPGIQDVQFSCTQEQLQDFVGKLKDATKCLEKISTSQ